MNMVIPVLFEVPEAHPKAYVHLGRHSAFTLRLATSRGGAEPWPFIDVPVEIDNFEPFHAGFWEDRWSKRLVFACFGLF